ncbi:MAG: signal peptidase II [Ardenticatenaceae bacterium]|nr:signal peptidase II [Ardenticatenaceae bacterium]
MIYLAMLLAFLADRLTKWWAADYLTEHGLTRVNEWLTFRAAYNRGISFGMFQGIGPAVGWITLLFLLGLFIYQMRLPKQAWLLRLGLAVLIGGAMGNLVDRIFVGEVLDFIQTPLRQGIFNVADMMIHLGMILVFLGVWQQERREKQQRRETADPA